MPDVTVSFTDAQWTRIVAATSNIKRINEDGDYYFLAMSRSIGDFRLKNNINLY